MWCNYAEENTDDNQVFHEGRFHDVSILAELE